MSANEEGRRAWDAKANFWDDLYGDNGNRFHRTLISPPVERLLAIQPGERVLDVACGNGTLARRLNELGAIVTATDFSSALIRLARKRGPQTITYRVVDATDEDGLAALGPGNFDAVVCTMALMDMPDIAPLFRAARRLLVPGGRMIFATMHPAFNSNNPVFLLESGDRDGQLYDQTALKLTGYLDLPPTMGAGAPGEPAPHPYYHRPLHGLFSAMFAAGFVLDALKEPAFPRPQHLPADHLSWVTMWQFPPVIVGRLRPGMVSSG